MGKEIERKFLVKNDSYKAMAVKVNHIEQGYISLRPTGTVRVRVKNDCAFLTIKGLNEGAVRDEWEYEIPLKDAREMLDRVTEGTVIKKNRYIVEFSGRYWEVDEFEGAHSGLVLAEIELNSEGDEIDLPPFIGAEVTGDERYYNSTLAR